METNNLNSYRLTSLEEPSDSQLSALMKEVAEEAKRKSEEAHKKYFENMFNRIERKKREWSVRFNVSFKDA